MTTAAASTLRLVLRGLSDRHLDLAPFLAELGLTLDQVIEPDARIPGTLALRAWQRAAALTGDPAFGLRLAASISPMDFGALGYAMYSSATLGQSLHRLVTAFRLVSQLARLEVVERGAVVHVRLTVAPEDPELARHPSECTLARLVLGARAAATAPVPIHEVAFRHAAPADDDLHRARFGVAPVFGRPHTEVCLPRAALALPVRSAAPATAAALDRHLRRLIAELPADETFVDRARRALAELLRSGAPSVEALAARLGVSPRTAQRRLADADTSFQGLLDEVRGELARRHVGDRQDSLGEIAFLLGFSEPSAFHRAFKRWTGMTPAAYRAARRAAPPS